ncbi:phosphoribosylamine--glycine ligase [Pseudemcibacter aquimaris]|uniref:phosphoribosylamine--glycine ligase n=1 Tax=Pseudemcibacter aquimaris TaxID=2857064 RepID=UPI0020139FA5|nr:phosphoribosylamine--glycine ligase [Pseudemcibacter aquimaris]MCC3862301.1 phosphoribosylamine--glycine ligase [Pseudemcibacter aquimaris]WDU59049.1 phosphoribosylamine--glycine ligase [Pseudemcibacter aquimaris]
MNILVIGSGGREHSLSWKIAQSDLCDELYVAPGNGGMGDIATCVSLDDSNHAEVINFCRDKNIEFVVIGPEAPLVGGLSDALTEAGIKTFGPSAAASILEGSKGFTKDLCAKYDIPTAAYGRFTNAEAAKEFTAKQNIPVVIKADGLAAGKGVIIAESMDDAFAAIDDILGGQFGDAGAELVVEEFLSGEEASFFVLCDGENILPFGTAQDHKRVGEGDTGLNTGGMGAYSPAPVMTNEMIDRTINEIIMPTVKGMAAEGKPFKGVFFAGLMITDKGPELIEYNVRFGDPECQTLMMRLNSDIVPALMACADGTLDQISVDWSEKTAMNVVMAAKGYPGSYEKNTEINNLDDAGAADNVTIFHAGTKKDGEQILATGGRVLNITSLSDSVTNAAKDAYAALDKIEWPGGFCRRDIGWRAIEREKN